MITTETVLVLGAGASVPYGFPTGQQLVTKVLNMDVEAVWGAVVMRMNRPAWNAVRSETDRFRDELEGSRLYSVDAFLEQRPEFMRVGKSFLSAALLELEDPGFSILRSSPGDAERPHDWYQYLWNKLVCSIEEFGKNKLSIVTYNYDRSLEHYLYRAMLSTWGASTQLCVEALRTIPIIHVHGSLGTYPLPHSQATHDGLNYSGEAGANEIEIAMQGIQVICEDLSKYPEYMKAVTSLTQAVRVYFIGFGFNDVNYGGPQNSDHPA